MGSSAISSNRPTPAQFTAEFQKVSQQQQPSQAALNKLATDYKDTYGANADPNIQKLLNDAAQNPQNAAKDLQQIVQLAEKEYGSQSADGPASTGHADGHAAPSTPDRQS